MSGNRRLFLKTGGTVLIGSLAGCAGNNNETGGNGDESGEYALNIPNTVRIVVHTSEGGGYDTYARLMAQHMSKYIDNDVIVENITGAGGQIAIQEVVNSNPDGTTLQLADTQGFSIMQAQGENDGWDFTEFTHLAGVAEDVRSLNLSNDSGVETFKDYVTAVQNDKLTFGWDGPTTSIALVPVFIGELGGYYDPKIVIERGVQFDGGSEIRSAMKRSEVQVAGGSWASNYQQHNDGAFNMLLYMADVEKPPKETPDIETLQTANVNNANQIGNLLTGRRHFVGPPGMANDLTESLRKLFDDVTNSDEFLQAAEEAGRPVNYIPGKEFEEFVPNHIELWKNQQGVLDVISE